MLSKEIQADSENISSQVADHRGSQYYSAALHIALRPARTVTLCTDDREIAKNISKPIKLTW